MNIIKLVSSSYLFSVLREEDSIHMHGPEASFKKRNKAYSWLTEKRRSQKYVFWRNADSIKWFSCSRGKRFQITMTYSRNP